MKFTEDQILFAIGSEEASTFGEFCSRIEGCPARGNRAGWSEVFAALERCEHQALVIVERVNKTIGSLELTSAVAQKVRAKLDRDRPLFASLQ